MKFSCPAAENKHFYGLEDRMAELCQQLVFDYRTPELWPSTEEDNVSAAEKADVLLLP